MILMDWLKEYFAEISNHPLLLSALIVLSSIIIAKLADIIPVSYTHLRAHET